MTFGSLLFLTPIFKAVGGKQPHHNYGRRRQKWPSITAHELQFWEHTRRIDRGTMPRASGYFFLAMRGSIPLRMLQWQGDDSNESCIVIGAF
jgi:hypothetical protein